MSLRSQVLADFREVQRLRGMPSSQGPDDIPPDRTMWLAYRRSVRDLEGRRIVGSDEIRH